ncbi:glycosyltransferase [Flavobacterium sp. AS60]|uniref:glycosyltransferase family 2 protein n=1 Tax=Flavobacterium anseongense TaxID=2910677 RepID=UPI001F3FD0C8|nr:glycosyltransferase [Flavobacterium sp. AS60]MCF6129218.1 glycosyltransferase [Flavobacterium sp. AS60]
MIALLFCAILLIYVALIVQLIFGFNKVKSFEVTDLTPKTAFTIVVPFRNEAKNLPTLLESISNLNYPHKMIEIILVDDFSTDNSERICIQWRMKYEHLDTTLLENLHLSYSPKKDAIGRAMPIAKHDWVVTTDADCILNKNWLLTFDNYIQNNNPEMIVGTVMYKAKNNWFHHFQQLDLMSLQGVTIGSFGIGKPFMCNGANFGYTKKFFYEIGGFGGISDTASGDDVFLLQKAVNTNPDKVHYLKNTDSIVKTRPENDLFKLFMQRVRWAGKSTGYKSSYAKFLAVVVLLMNFSLVVGCWLLVVGKIDWRVVLFVFGVKYIIDYTLLYKSNSYLRNGKFFVPIASSVIYPFFSSLVGIYSLFGSFRWKGRKFSN